MFSELETSYPGHLWTREFDTLDLMTYCLSNYIGYVIN